MDRRQFIQSMFAGAATASLLPASGASKAPPPSTGRAPEDHSYWRWVADQFMLHDGLAYMNTGTRGPSPWPVYEAQVKSIFAANADRLSYARHVHNAEYKQSVRAKLADFVGCKSNEVAFTNNTTEGMVIGTFGPDLKKGDEIIYTNHDHSSGGQPVNLRCARQGTVPVVVDLSDRKFHPPDDPSIIVEAFDKAITKRTRLISFCHVNYTDGCVMPVQEICDLARSRGVLTLVDGAHPPGMLDLDIAELGCDMYSGACHKWMCAAQLTGFFFVKEELQDRIWPAMYSGPVKDLSLYGMRAGESSLERAHSAERYEMHGSGNFAAGVSIEAAVDFHSNIGKSKIEARDRYLAERVRSGLENIRGVEVFSSRDPRSRAGLVSFRVRNLKTGELSDLLWERHRIYIRNVTHEEIGWDANRASMHIMVTTAQADNLVAAVEEIAKERKA